MNRFDPSPAEWMAIGGALFVGFQIGMFIFTRRR